MLSYHCGGWISRRWIWSNISWIKHGLLGTWKSFMSPGLITTKTHQIEVILVMRNNVVHGVDITLPTNGIAIENIHGCAETRKPFRQGVILGGFPIANKDIMGWRLWLLHWVHPHPYCSLECNGSILLNIFRMSQQVKLQCFPNLAVIEIPTTTNNDKNSAKFS